MFKRSDGLAHVVNTPLWKSKALIGEPSFGSQLGFNIPAKVLPDGPKTAVLEGQIELQVSDFSLSQSQLKIFGQ